MMICHCSRVIGNLLDMATSPVAMDTASTSTLQERVVNMLEIELDDDEVKKHLYKVRAWPFVMSSFTVFLTFCYTKSYSHCYTDSL